MRHTKHHMCNAKHAHMQRSCHGSKLWVSGLVYRWIGCHSLTIVSFFKGTWHIDADGLLLSHYIIDNIMIPLYYILTPGTHISRYYGNPLHRRQKLNNMISDYVGNESVSNFCNHHSTQRPTVYPMKLAHVYLYYLFSLCLPYRFG